MLSQGCLGDGRKKLTEVLLYELEQGKTEEQIIDQAFKVKGANSGRLPEVIKNAPELNLGLRLYYQAFSDLSSCRPIGFEDGPIPWFAIQTYGEMLELDEEEMIEFHYLLRAMDNAYFKYKEERRAKKSGSTAPRSDSGTEKVAPRHR